MPARFGAGDREVVCDHCDVGVGDGVAGSVAVAGEVPLPEVKESVLVTPGLKEMVGAMVVSIGSL